MEVKASFAALRWETTHTLTLSMIHAPHCYFRLYLLYDAMITYIQYVIMMAQKSRCFHRLRKSALPFVPRFRRVRLLLLDSSTDPKLVFLDSGKTGLRPA